MPCRDIIFLVMRNTYVIISEKRARVINLDLIVKAETCEWENKNGKTDYFINFYPIVGNTIQAKFSDKDTRDREFSKIVKK